MWGAIPTKPYLLMLLQQLLHKVWGIEDTIISVISLGRHSTTLNLPINSEFFLHIFIRVYIHLVLDAQITTCMVNKNTPAWKNIRWISLALCVIYTTWIPQDIMICRHHLSRQKITLLDLFLLHRIILYCINFIVSANTVSKLTVIILGTFKVCHCLEIFLRLQTPLKN